MGRWGGVDPLAESVDGLCVLRELQTVGSNVDREATRAVAFDACLRAVAISDDV